MVRWLANGLQRLAFSAVVASDPTLELWVGIPVMAGTQPSFVDLPGGLPLAELERLFPKDYGRARGGGGGGGAAYERGPPRDRSGLERGITVEGEGHDTPSVHTTVLRVRNRSPVGFFEKHFGGGRHFRGIVDFAPRDPDHLFIPSATNLREGSRVIVFVQAQDYPGWDREPNLSRPLDEGFESNDTGELPDAPGLLDPALRLFRGERRGVRDDLGVWGPKP